MNTSQLEGFRKALHQGPNGKRPRIIAVGSGKGGVGKTSFSLAVSALWARNGSKVLLTDADPGLADLNIFLGLNPELHWGHFLRGERTFNEIVMKNALPRMDFVHGFSGVSDPAWMQGASAQKLLEELGEQKQDYDWTVLDVGAGLAEPNLVFLSSVDLFVLVISPELTSLADAYGTLKTVHRRNPSQRIAVVVNQAETMEQARLAYLNLVKISAQFLGIRLPLLGWIPKDPELPRSLARQSPLVLSMPSGPYAFAVSQIANVIDHLTLLSEEATWK